MPGRDRRALSIEHRVSLAHERPPQHGPEGVAVFDHENIRRFRPVHDDVGSRLQIRYDHIFLEPAD